MAGLSHISHVVFGMRAALRALGGAPTAALDIKPPEVSLCGSFCEISR